jgi:hypothetical protein
MNEADDGMYGVKKISPKHLDEQFFYHWTVYSASDPKRAWMNFQREDDASRLPPGHRALVYVNEWCKFIWAIEFLEIVEPGDYEKVLLAPHKLKKSDLNDTWKWIRPIRFLARMNEANKYENAPRYDDQRLLRGEKPLWKPLPSRGGISYLSKDDYEYLYSRIPWHLHSEASMSQIAPPKPVASVPPPAQDADALLALLELIRKNKEEGYPEAHTRLLVQKFLLLLGHSERRIVFEVGRIDVLVDDTAGNRWGVFEVKRSLGDRKTVEKARRQAFDYANRVAARFVVITDADWYHIWDNERGGNYDAKFSGKFQLTRYECKDEPVLNLLRPKL